MQTLSIMLATKGVYFFLGAVFLFALLFIIMINLYLDLSHLKKRYKKMMTGVDGANLERMLMGHIDEIRRVVEENMRLDDEERRMNAILERAITKVGVVRYSAFEDMGSDLSYSVALLDSFNNGVIFTSIFAREDSRSYAKPIDRGESSYTLTKEEKEALNLAIKGQ